MKKIGKILKRLLQAGIIAAYIGMVAILIWQALTPGEESADISQNVGDRLDEIITDVKEPEITEIRVSDVKIQSVTVSGKTYKDDAITMLVGETGRIQCKVFPEDATKQSVTYSSSDHSVLTVSSDGRITAKSTGTATVTIVSEDNPELTDTVTVTVKEVAIEGIEIAEPEMDISVGEKLRLELKFTPANTTEKSVSWKSSDTSVLTVNKSGTITAISEGEATVTAISTVNGEIRATLKITVHPKKEEPQIPVESVAITASEDVGYVGKTLALSLKLYPEGAEDSVVWHSSDESVATISQKGILTCHKAGDVTITATCSSGIEGSITVTVKEVLSKNIHLDFDGIDYTEEQGYLLKQGQSGKITATLDEDATVLHVVYTTSDEEIAKIGEDGVIEAIRGGEVTITVSTSYDGEVTSTSFNLVVERISLKDTVKNFYLIVRKSIGHFGAFLILGIFAALSYYIVFKKNLLGKLLAFVVCLFAGFAVAGITEILQLPYFTPGRTCSFDDVILDFKGYCTSVIPIFVLILIGHLLISAVKAIKGRK